MSCDMDVVRKIVAGVAAVALAVVFVGLGFLVCIAPFVTHGLSSTFSLDDVSPFDRNQLVKVADATRDYSFGAHDKLALYQVIYDVDAEYQNKLVAAGGMAPADFPVLNAVRDRDDVNQYESAFEYASEMYCYSPQTISHLDDCFAIFNSARSVLIAMAIIAIAALAFTGATGGKRRLGSALFTAGLVVLVLFLAAGVWAVIDFNGLFTTFHQVFFAQQGNWTFPYDSLLICSLPEAFWMGMGAVCLAVAIIVSILSILLGRKLMTR